MGTILQVEMRGKEEEGKLGRRNNGKKEKWKERIGKARI